MDIDMGRNRETNNIIRLTNWRRNAKREISKESMTDSYEIKNSVFKWLKIIEMKKFVDDGMLLRMKITLTIWQYKNTSTTRTNDGFIQISKVLILCHWRHRSDFKQALSTWQRLQQEAGEEPHVPTYSYKHEQWEARSSSSTWWNWQGSWWTPHQSESQEGGAPSSECTGRLRCLQYLASFFETDFHEFNLFCYRLIVYSWRRSTVTDGVCTDNTSNDPFSRCTSVQEFGYRWNWRSQNTVWLQVHNWTTKFKRKELCTWYCVCVVKPSTTPMTTWQPRSRHFPHKAHETLHCLFSLVLLASAHSWVAHRIAWLQFHLCASSHGHHMMSVFFRPWVLRSLPLPHLLIHL